MRSNSLLVVMGMCLSIAGFALPAEVSSIRPKQSAGPRWSMADLAPVAPELARSRLHEASRDRDQRKSHPALPLTETEASAEILALARSLGLDAGQIFEFVHKRIEYTPTFGSVNGATGTFLAGRGNDWDQASLLIALLRASGYTADYVLGDVTYPLATAANWVGVAATPELVEAVFANGGVPIGDVSTTSVTLTRIWVQASIGGSVCQLDPALKAYSTIEGIPLDPVLGYDRDTFMADSLIGASTTADSVSLMNESNLRANLADLGMNLVEHLRDVSPLATVDEVLGGRRIVPEAAPECPSPLPEALRATRVSTFAEIPDAYRVSQRLRLWGCGIDHTFFTFQISGRRVSISHRLSDNAPELRVDGDLIASGPSISPGHFLALTISVDHPFADNAGDQGFNFYIRSGASSVIASNFDNISNSLMVKRNGLLADALNAGAATDSEPVLGESLWIAGITYFLENQLYQRILGQLGRTVFTTHHFIGILTQEEKYLMDMALSYFTVCRKDGQAARPAVFRAISMLGSAFEHGALEQLQSGDPAASTIKLLQFNNTQGRKTYLVNAANWNAVQAELVNYDGSVRDAIATGLASGSEFVLPQDGHQVIQDFIGSGYIEHLQAGDVSNMGMIIYWYLAGGIGVVNKPLDPNKVQQNAKNMNKPPDKKVETPQKDEPVDMTTGNLHHQWQDLALPNLGAAEISFRRYYNSADADTDGPLGYGWRHNLAPTLVIHSDPNPCLGSRQPTDAASLIAYTRVVLDLLQHRRDVSGWLAAALSAKWAMDQMIDNLAAVFTDSRAIEYVRLPDGDFNPPPGFHSRLAASGDSFFLQGEGHSCYIFGQSGQLDYWLDTNGNSISFTRARDGRLTRVENSFGQHLDFTYTGSRITAIVDESGRGVAYEYAGGNLSRFLDAEGHAWRYQYDPANRLLALTNPEGNSAMTNVYDELGRIRSQTNGTGDETAYLINGATNATQDADGSQSAYEVDDAGQMAGYQDPAGNLIEHVRDGQGYLREITDRLGDTTRAEYHLPSGRLASVQDPEGNITLYTYAAFEFTFNRPGRGREAAQFTFYPLARTDYPDGTYQEFQRDGAGNITAVIERDGRSWTFTHNGRGQIISATNPLGGMATSTYNADGTLAAQGDSDIGPILFEYDSVRRLERVRYPDGRTIAYTFDRTDQLTAVTHPDGTATAFEYDGNGNQIRVTDPLGRHARYVYDAMERVIQVVDRAGHSTDLAYDNRGRMVSVTDPTAAPATLEYSVTGRPTKVSLAGAATEAVYDPEGTLARRSTVQGHTTTYVTDRLGRVTAVTDPLGRTLAIDRDAMGNVTSILDPLSRETHRSFDQRDLLAGVTMAGIGTAQYERNSLGYLSRITDLNAQDWTFEHSSMGRRTALVDPLGHRREYTYDSSGRVTQILFPNGLTQVNSFDQSGNRVQESFSDGTDLHYTFDALGKLTGATGIALVRDEESRVTHTTSGGLGFGAVYRPNGEVQSVDYLDGAFQVHYTYHPQTGLLTEVTDTLTGTWVRFDYDQDGQTTCIHRSNGVDTSWTWDPAGQLTRIQDGIFIDLQFSLDAAGQITGTQMTAPLVPEDHLVAELAESRFGADSAVRDGVSDYDALGRAVRTAEHSFNWAGESQLIGVDAAVLDYNDLGFLQNYMLSGQTHRYFYNWAIDTQPVVAEGKAAGREGLRFYVWTPTGQLLYMIDGTRGNAVYFYHFDQVGSTLALTDAAGAIADAYAYTPQGEVMAHLGENPQPFTFVGQFGGLQAPSGGDLYLMRARWYDADAGRFLSRDPNWPNISDPRELNPYQYAVNNPVLLIDPIGRWGGFSVARLAQAMQKLKKLAPKLKPVGSGVKAQGNSTTKCSHKMDPLEAAMFGIIAQVPGSLEIIDSINGERSSMIGKPEKNWMEDALNMPAYSPPKDAVEYIGGGVARDMIASPFTLLKFGLQLGQDAAHINVDARESSHNLDYQGFWPELQYQFSKQVAESKVLVPALIRGCEMVEEGYTRIGEWATFGLQKAGQAFLDYCKTPVPGPQVTPTQYYNLAVPDYYSVQGPPTQDHQGYMLYNSQLRR